jgi:hypothetical protein
MKIMQNGKIISLARKGIIGCMVIAFLQNERRHKELVVKRVAVVVGDNPGAGLLPVRHKRIIWYGPRIRNHG